MGFKGIPAQINEEELNHQKVETEIKMVYFFENKKQLECQQKRKCTENSS
jgi:hypothetical protein